MCFLCDKGVQADISCLGVNIAEHIFFLKLICLVVPLKLVNLCKLIVLLHSPLVEVKECAVVA